MTSSGATGSRGALDDREAAALDAVLAVVLPSTSGPGASEADAGRYVHARLAGADAGWLVPLRRWLADAVIDPSGALDGDRVAAAVAALAAGNVDGATGAPGLFEQVRLWAWSGYLCDPARGGNVAGVGWDRFDWSPPAGRTHTASSRR